MPSIMDVEQIQSASGTVAVVSNMTVLDVPTTENNLKAAPVKLVRGLALGVDQTWQDVAASRVAGTNYTNTTGKPISVSIALSAMALNATAVIFVDGVSAARCGNGGVSVAVFGPNIDAIVPPGGVYSLTLTAASSINRWSELR